MIIRPTYPLVQRAVIDPITNAGAAPWEVRGRSSPFSRAGLLAKVGTTCKFFVDHNPTSITLVSGRVSSWADQSGNAFDVAQGTSAMRPDGTTTINSLLAPGFSNGDGTQDRLDGGQAISGIISASAWHCFVVFRLTSHLATPGNFYDEALLVADSGGFWSAGSISTSGAQCGNWDGALRQTGQTAYVAVSDATNTLLETSFGSGTLSCRVGAGAAVTHASGDISTLTGTIRLGDRSSSGHLQGSIALVMLCNTQLSASTAAYVRAYCSAIYGVAS